MTDAASEISVSHRGGDEMHSQRGGEEMHSQLGGTLWCFHLEKLLSLLIL